MLRLSSTVFTYLWFEGYIPKYTLGVTFEVSCDHGMHLLTVGNTHVVIGTATISCPKQTGGVPVQCSGEV